jgi:hypothetical protein
MFVMIVLTGGGKRMKIKYRFVPESIYLECEEDFKDIDRVVNFVLSIRSKDDDYIARKAFESAKKIFNLINQNDGERE